MQTLEHATLSRNGTREINEDSHSQVVTEQGALFLVADGLGGHGRGDEASRFVVEVAAALYRENPEGALEDVIGQSQEHLLRQQALLGVINEMKTTLTALRIDDRGALLGHVGDSRIYHFRKHKLVARTLDHSVPQAMVSTGEIREKDIRGHADRNRLLRVMGTEWNSPKYEIQPAASAQTGDRFLLCTDGFWEWIDEKKMQKTLRAAKSPGEWLGLMEQVILANGRGGSMDNYTATAVWIV